MFDRLTLLPAAFVAAAIGFGQPAPAQDGPDPDKVVATVNGTEITLAHMIALRSSLPQQYSQLPPDVLFNGILDQLIQQTLLMHANEDDLSKRSKIMLENERRAIIAGEKINEVMDTEIGEAELQTAYEAKYVDAEDETEYRAAHILVESEEKAQSLVDELSEGADFAALAKEHSTGPSAASGGDLGWFGEGVMVQSFFDAVAALEPGEVSQPVKTEFGWHVIKLKETRVKERPELAEVREELETELQQAAFDNYVASLQAEAEIDRAGTEGIDPGTLNKTDLLEE
jgi:peptidyl-prolyl cis-trans isomerase C